MVQVVLGVLGCPNLPQQPIQEEDGAAGVAERVGTEGIGCLFTGVQGQGAFFGPLNGKALLPIMPVIVSNTAQLIHAGRSLAF